MYGCWTLTLPTEGRLLYADEEKLSQMLPAMALVASGLQALVSSSVTGTRRSVVSALLLSVKSGAMAMVFMAFLNSAVLVQFQ